MKHRRGIDLLSRKNRYDITYLGPVLTPENTAFEDIPEWYALGGHCPKCERTGWLTKGEVPGKLGKGSFLGSQRLRCLSCGNRDGNKWILGQLPRSW